MSTAFKIHEADNVATLLSDAPPGVITLSGCGEVNALTLVESIALGHKAALRDIAAGEAVTKYGVTVGIAKAPIARGAWVHLHNCSSRYDVRSNNFDPITGAAQDTHYG